MTTQTLKDTAQALTDRRITDLAFDYNLEDVNCTIPNGIKRFARAIEQSILAKLNEREVAPQEPAESVAAKQQGPSDEEIGNLYTTITGDHVWSEDGHAKVVKFAHEAHALLSRYGQSASAAQPADVVNRLLTNPLTPYGLFIRALRVMAGVTLMDMSEATGYTPSYLSGAEFGRYEVSPVLLKNSVDFFIDKGLPVTPELFAVALKTNGGAA